MLPAQRSNRSNVGTGGELTKTPLYQGQKNAAVNNALKSLNLSESKQKQAASLADELYEVVNNCDVKLEKKAYYDRLESLLVERGVPPSVASKSPDYRGIARLIADAAVAAE